MIKALPALADNYIWVYAESDQAVVVDPGVYQPVLDYLRAENLNLAYILITHGHSDHVDGITTLKAAYPKAIVIGPKETAQLVDQVVSEGDEVSVLSTNYHILKAAGHTAEHIVYVSEQSLFSGDALFAGGCGRVFTGDYEESYEGMQKLVKLPDNLQVYAGHEYTETNLKCAQSLFPNDAAICAAQKRAEKLLAQGKPTLPTTLSDEKNYNIFLTAKSVAEFKKFRDVRDTF